jgi:hypothetical protein
MYEHFGGTYFLCVNGREDQCLCLCHCENHKSCIILLHYTELDAGGLDGPRPGPWLSAQSVPRSAGPGSTHNVGVNAGFRPSSYDSN